MSSYVYRRDDVAKYLPKNDDQLDIVPEEQDLSNGNIVKKDYDISKSEMKNVANISKLGNGGNNRIIGQQLKGNSSIGGLGFIQGLGKIGKRETKALFNNSPEIPSSGLGYDVLGKMEAMGKHNNNHVPETKVYKHIEEACHIKGSAYTPEQLDVGFIQMATRGYRTKEHGPEHMGDAKMGCEPAHDLSKVGISTTGLILPQYVKQKSPKNLKLKISQEKIAKAGATSIYGYRHQYDIDEWGYPIGVPKLAVANLINKGAKLYPKVTPITKQPYGTLWSDGGGYGGAGYGPKGTNFNTNRNELTHVDAGDGSGNPTRKGPSGPRRMRMPIQTNSNYPIVNHRLV